MKIIEIKIIKMKKSEKMKIMKIKIIKMKK